MAMVVQTRAATVVCDEAAVSLEIDGEEEDERGRQGISEFFYLNIIV